MRENNYDGYTQMYERAVKDGHMVLTDSDPLNPARVRAAADDIATFPSQWGTMDFDAARQKWNQPFTINAPQTPPRRGLSPAGPSSDRIMGIMSPGPLSQKPTQDSVAKLAAMNVGSGPPPKPPVAEYVSDNPYFNPKTKQVFSAVNYGRRPHGSCTEYGHSYMVLAEKFKTNALYFAEDTFGVFLGKNVKADDQAGYLLLGAIYLKAAPKMRQAIIQSCLNDGTLPDTKDKELLMEAHLFEPLEFTGGITEIFTSAKDEVLVDEGPPRQTRPMTSAEWQTIQENARKFAAKHGAKLYFIE